MRSEPLFQFLVCLDKSRMAGKGVVAPGVPSGKWWGTISITHHNFPYDFTGGEILLRLVPGQALVRVAIKQQQIDSSFLQG